MSENFSLLKTYTNNKLLQMIAWYIFFFQYCTINMTARNRPRIRRMELILKFGMEQGV